MSFISITYSCFLLAVLGIYWLLQRSTGATGSPKLKLLVLVISSLIFYASLQIQYIPLLVLITLINFYFGQALGTNTVPGSHATNYHLSNEEWLL
ncbi:MAG: MBOAT family protein, partial [Moorea sp. SIO3H5]|nr:MBOAT family protein [Moorena sp. SIO3H5]